MEPNLEPITTPETIPPVSNKPSKPKRKLLKIILGTLGVVLLAIAITAAVLLYGSLITIGTLKEVDTDLYRIHYRQDYHLDKALSSNISTEQEFLDFISKNFFFGYPIEGNQDYIACSAFLTQNADGGYLTGRNFDYSETDLLAVYTTPRDGYASIAMAPLAALNIDFSQGIEKADTVDKLATLAAPYMCADGMNEKGLTVSALDLTPVKIRQNTGKPKLPTMLAIRLLLDRAATVDEAVALLRQYDFYSISKYAQHLFISDAQGNAVVVEWAMNNVLGETSRGFEMQVIESPVCTNFWMSQVPEFKGQCKRFDTITQRLTDQPINTQEDAMSHLEAASVGWTEWSCVYHMSDFSVDVSLDTQYDKVCHLSPDDFR